MKLSELKDFYYKNRQYLDYFLSDDINYNSLFRKLDILNDDIEEFIKISEEATKIHYDNCYEELEYYKMLAEKNYHYECELKKAITDTCELHNIPEDEYLSGNYDFDYDEYDEFLLDLVNTIAEYYGINNHYGF